MSTLRKAIQLRMVNIRVSQTALSRVLGMSQAQLSRFLSAKAGIRSKTLDEMLKLLGMEYIGWTYQSKSEELGQLIRERAKEIFKARKTVVPEKDNGDCQKDNSSNV